jgi:hypothetical protein
MTDIRASIPPDPLKLPMTLPVEERLRRFNWLETRHVGADGVARVPPEFVVEQGRAVLILDTREADSLTGPLGYVPGSVWVPLAEIDAVAAAVPPDTMTVLVSRRGTDAGEAVKRLNELGMTWVAAMNGGVWAWRSLGYDTLRDPAILQTRGRVAAPSQDAPPSERRVLTQSDIETHVGDAGSMRWLKLAAVMLRGKTSCVDGRDDHGVIGSPGGDTGEFLLGLATLESLTGQRFDAPAVTAILRAWTDAFGSFYMHTDVTAYRAFMASMNDDPRLRDAVAELTHPGAWRRFMMAPPTHLRSAVLDHLVIPANVGCGHLRLILQNPGLYGVRTELAQIAIRAFHQLRWDDAMEPEFVVLGGGHQEGAVVLVEIDGAMEPFTHIPLVSPATNGTQFFVGHPQVLGVQRRMFSEFLAQNPCVRVSPAERRALLGAVEVLAERQQDHTLGRLAPGLPIFQVRFSLDRSFRVSTLRPAG